MRSLQLKKGALKWLLSIGRRERRGGDGDGSSPTAESDGVEQPTWRCFPYDEIFHATEGFHPGNLVGRGGYAEVYKGVLRDGRRVAVKRLAQVSTEERREKEFLTELGTVGHVRHPTSHLSSAAASTATFTSSSSSPPLAPSPLSSTELPPVDWKLRQRIAVGTAKGLRYLHKGCRRRIIHRDVKASNILLTADYEPQISDFGLARWLPSEWTHRAVAPIEGTFGSYLAPEYFMHGMVDEKTDVFAFGVLLLEIISGRKPVDGFHHSLLNWARPHLHSGAMKELVDPELGDDYDGDQLERMVFAASLCTRAAAAWRPSMDEVVEMLEGGEISREMWNKALEEGEEPFWDLDDLDDLDDMDEFDSSLSSPSSQTNS
ncbi:unnamed protein product [Spirodela intermedia]|uniref:Protein kinase domain-containing protein n=1 Tax=Spirodela intermedia TaxID=51605 RepID=A0A7I8JPX0_SPIIN|nr:unnamed protein product [Spirodela intermedia]CAA6672196.1 unnamed protein product [Spirodela intermedia]